ncbi:arylsulfatase [Paraglaciecola sp.]|uniref:arylsulfatase n=1 Tax=Paraglaciecola sp. TaxID=1920173 RepID=UPI003EF7A495
MKYSTIYLFFLFVALATALHSPAIFAGSKVTLPNIVLIVTDDQGWGDLSFNGNPVLQTPHIDSLAIQGVSFERFYVNPVCSSTRAALMTGRYYARTGVFSVTRGGEKMRESEITLAEMLKEKGYRTGLFGKWHNGSQYPHDPNGQGFDESFGVVDGHQTLYFDPMLVANGKPYQGKGYIADITTNAAIQFIQNAKSQPFFAYIPFNTPHSPFEVPQKYFDKYKKMGQSDLNASVYGMMENVDDNVGRILAKVKELNLAQDTIVLYMSDNGPAFPNKTPRFNGGLKGSKGKVDEGGVRSPFFVHWPNKITGGRTISTIAQHIDVVPTLMSIVGGELPTDRKIDGVDISPLLFDTLGEKPWPKRSLFVNQFKNIRKVDEQAINAAPGAVRTQDWLATYQRNGKWDLYNMQTDELQKFDLSKKHPLILTELKKQYFEFFKDVTQVKYEFIPTEVGHEGYDTVNFPAHDSLIKGDDVAYAHEWGWSHDWISLTHSDNTGEINWPAKVVTKGKYRVSLKYAAESFVKVTGQIRMLGQSYPISITLDKYSTQIDKGNRLYYTNEAPELTWATMTLGVFELTPSSAEIGLELNSVLMEDIQNKLLIKGVEITKL